MSYPYIHAAVARERQDTLLAEARDIHRAREARSHRRASGTRAAHGSWFRWMPARLPPAWSRPLTSQPQSGSEATG